MSSETNGPSLTKSPVSSNVFSKYPFQLSLLFVCVYMLSHCSRVQLRNPVDRGSPGSSVHGVLQARTPRWVALSSSRESSQLENWTRVSCLLLLAGRFFTPAPHGPQLQDTFLPVLDGSAPAPFSTVLPKYLAILTSLWVTFPDPPFQFYDYFSSSDCVSTLLGCLLLWLYF